MAEQTAILPGAPRAGRYLSFSIRQGVEAAECIDAVQALSVDNRLAVGIGEPLVAHCSTSIEGLRTFPALSGPGIEVPSTQHALWCWLRGEDHGELVNRSNAIVDSLAPTFVVQECVNSFRHGDGDLGLDLTGYEDGTENPTGDDAVNAAIASGRGDGLDGSSFVAVQKWVHDLREFSQFPEGQQDLIIGRRKSDNEEIEDAPASAHTKRTEQESFSPEAFVVRRSMPWADQSAEGLMFVAFGNTLDAYEAQLRRMVGLEDGIPDALFRFSRAVSGGYYWCPPLRDGRLDIGRLTNS